MHTRTVVFRLILALVASVVLIAIACDKGEEPTNGHIGDGDDILSGAAVSVSGVDGLVGGKIPIDQQVTFRIRFENLTGHEIQGFTNGFRVYSPGGARWTATVAESTGTLTKDYFNQIFVNHHSPDGANVDTVGLGGFVIMEPGMPVDFADDVMTIQVGPINVSYAGRTLCIDSSAYAKVTWQWSAGNNIAGRPTWSGPHCYQIGQ
ncbi:MAG: hypothetical protein ABIE70_04500 [bacterium]